jgi:hypothetical protein
MYKIVLFFGRLKKNEERKFISLTGMTFSFIRRSQDIRNKNVLRKMDEVSDYPACRDILTEYVKI